ncbi:Vi polysaccharide biosynthesis protein VipA/TviB [Arcobacter suis]|uniref:Polysaccharide biosynthesis protein, nucleotide sugar dehydrogenase, TviB family n=1 Tax=Arcobacter suis CECT 7833 TaxID=663365 RepID=A0AAD0WRD3_9BACT|nr:nucleotide sugar dehydrogenase [Arcobacter suis]AXX90463.1 polysaccharide biosynthesis protein, nucleotide sugar dehydrogenase, TviB family [Arcobacter suis CECT 7833]RWS45609.1 Vi polysaccharide biosynthesis protein VipA/TviB [Arcobacter suis]
MKNICVIGLGYVGLPLAHAFSSKYQVVGFDINAKRIEELNAGFDRTEELNEIQVKEAIKNGMKFSLDINDIKDCNVFIVTVPTPIDKNNRPDLRPLIKSSQTVGKVLKRDDIVIYESTVYPGVTEEVCVPELEKTSGLKFNMDFYCGYSPERINPGDKEHTVTKILKVTSGSTPKITEVVDELYKSIIIAGTYKASSIKVAEASKVIENTQRDVNIALINELALIFNTMNINTNEVIEAAATKWNFIKLTPGLVGGHCIGVDPYYLTYKAEELGYKPNLILGARQINNGMAKYIAEKTIKLMIKKGLPIKDSKVLVLGITFKENCPDVRNTKVVDIINEMKEYGCLVEVADYWADKNEVKHEYGLNLIENYNLNDYTAIIVAVGHEKYRGLKISTENRVVFDIKSILVNADGRL